MGGILTPSKESEIIKFLRHDNSKSLQDFLIKNNLDSDTLYTNRKRTLIQLCCYFSSPKCLSKLIEMNYDYNKKELSNDYTPLYIACRFNSLDLVKILLSQKKINILQKSNEDFNEFEISFLKGNYDICYFLLFEFKNNNIKIDKNKNKKNNKINIKNENEINTNLRLGNENDEKEDENKENKENEFNIDINNPYQTFFFSDDFNIDKYKSLQSTNQYPLFNMELFYESLINRIPPNQCESFAAERKRTKDLLTKIPDPNETWGHFFKRCANMELYNPPLVDKKNISHMNSLYMNTQMKLIENEYGVKMNYYNPNENTRNELIDDEEEDENPIVKVNTEKRHLKEETQNYESDNETQNNLKRSENGNDMNNNILYVNVHHKRNKERNKERKLEEIKPNTQENVSVLNINNKSSERPIKDKKEDEE